MGLSATISSAVQAAFTALGDIPQSVTYTSKGTSTYNPTTGAVTSTDTTYTVSMVLESYSSREIDNQIILSTDQKATIPQANLTPTPKVTDTITISSVVWGIVGIGQDPASATWVFQLRKP